MADFNFVVFGDIGLQVGGLTAFEQAVQKSLSYSPSLILVCGNLVPEGTEQNYRDLYTCLERVNKRYGVPIEVTPGNADRLKGVLPETYRYYFGEGNASFTLNGVKFISLDSSSGKLDVSQLQFLEKHLTVPSFIFTHYPPALGLWKFDALLEGTEGFLERLADRSNLVLGCFFGHIHAFSKEEVLVSGQITNIPAYVVGNCNQSYVVTENGYSRPDVTGGLVVMYKSGVPTFERLDTPVLT